MFHPRESSKSFRLLNFYGLQYLMGHQGKMVSHRYLYVHGVVLHLTSLTSNSSSCVKHRNSSLGKSCNLLCFKSSTEM